MALLRASSSGLVPTPEASGPWGPETLAGQVVTGLVGREAEGVVDRQLWRGARLSVDLVRMTCMSPLTCLTEIVHESRRLVLVDVGLVQDGKAVARGRATFVPRAEDEPRGRVWTGDLDMPSAPRPDADGGADLFERLRTYAGADTTGGNNPSRWAGGDEPKYFWWDVAHELVEGEEMTPFTRAAFVADTASPLTAWGTEGLEVINCDVSLTLVRDPGGSMIGMAARDHLAGPGGATGGGVVVDEHGPIGLVSVVALTFPSSRNAYVDAPATPVPSS